MNRRLAIILGIIAAVVVIAVAVTIAVNSSPRLQNLVLKVANRNSSGATNTPGATNTAAVNINKPVDPAATDRAAVTYVARNFTEMYGSYSNQEATNLQDVQVWGTKRLNDQLKQALADKSKLPPASSYQSFVTQALVMKITKLTTAAASVTVSTQRTETVDLDEKTYTQDLNLELVKTGKDWKVDAAIWRPK